MPYKISLRITSTVAQNLKHTPLTLETHSAVRLEDSRIMTCSLTSPVGEPGLELPLCVTLPSGLSDHLSVQGGSLRRHITVTMDGRKHQIQCLKLL